MTRPRRRSAQDLRSPSSLLRDRPGMGCARVRCAHSQGLLRRPFMAESLFEELKRYVGFGAPDEEALRELRPLVQPHFQVIAEGFYDRILSHEGSRKALL